MGQYHLPVNLTKREFIHPHKLGCGLKLWEQAGTDLGTGSALIMLCACSNGRGGGDFADEHENVIGRWAGDRIAWVGDYAEYDDLPHGYNADLIYSLCREDSEDEPLLSWAENYARERIERYEGDLADPTRKYALTPAGARKQIRFFIKQLERITVERAKGPYTDITPQVSKMLEREFNFLYFGDGWRHRYFGDNTSDATWLTPKQVRAQLHKVYGKDLPIQMSFDYGKAKREGLLDPETGALRQQPCRRGVAQAMDFVVGPEGFDSDVRSR